MAYASPSQIRAPYTSVPPGVAHEAGAARPHPSLDLRSPPRDAFREKAERQAKQKADRQARRKGVALPAEAVVAPVAPRARPKLAPKPVEVVTSAPVERPKPKLTVHVNPKTAPKTAPKPESKAASARGFAPLMFASATTAPPAPKPTEMKAPLAAPPEKPAARKGGGGGGGRRTPPPDVEKEKVVDRDLLMGGLISTALLLFFGWNMAGGKSAPPATPASPEPLLKVAAAPLPDPFPSLAPVDLRPKEPLPPAPPSAEPTKQAALPAAPEVTTAKAPPAKPVPAVSACQRVKMVQAYFCTASSTLTPDMRSALETQLTDWKACLGGEALVVKGYADARGGELFNASLSSRRAATLRDFLKTHDVKVSEAKGEGVLPGQAPQDCQNQRRVDVSIGETAPSAACAPPKDAPLPGCG